MRISEEEAGAWYSAAQGPADRRTSTSGPSVSCCLAAQEGAPAQQHPLAMDTNEKH